VHERVAVDLAGGGEEEPGALGDGKVEQVARAGGPHGKDLQRDAQEIERGRRAGEVEHCVDRSVDVEHAVGHVVLDQPEAVVAQEMLDVDRASGQEVVDGDHFVAALEQRVAQV
jgi:hypothetical protein